MTMLFDYSTEDHEDVIEDTSNICTALDFFTMSKQVSFTA